MQQEEHQAVDVSFFELLPFQGFTGVLLLVRPRAIELLNHLHD